MAKPKPVSFPWMMGGGGILLVSFNQHPLKVSFTSNWSYIPQYLSTEPHSVFPHWVSTLDFHTDFPHSVGMPQYLSTGPPAVSVSWEEGRLSAPLPNKTQDHQPIWEIWEPGDTYSICLDCPRRQMGRWCQGSSSSKSLGEGKSILGPFISCHNCWLKGNCNMRIES